MSAYEKCCFDADNGGSKAFSHLREFHIESFPKLTGNLPSSLPSLTLLVIRDCKHLLCPLPKSSSLRVLNIQNCQKLEFRIESSTMRPLRNQISNKLMEGKQNHSDPLLQGWNGRSSLWTQSLIKLDTMLVSMD
ncbi:hypothetical protein TSUD_371720 [Trifolium subterraneum]|uniref:Uncharacterized protein n=1 Tax=Trifolium subterraneum TaxID=3900 RepID=A0A2Z6NZ53_TRISU|nr:hypothetical protein TSUD_371720 [Trifolium subterraneum]